MQLRRPLLCGLLASAATASASATGNPLAKVFELLDGLSAKIRSDGEAQNQDYNKFYQWCDDVARNGENDIKTSSVSKSRLESAIIKLTSDAEVATSKISELAGLIATSEKDLKAATGIREQEAADFQAGEKELVQAGDALSRAISVLSKHGGSFAQLDAGSMSGTLQALSVIIDGAAFLTADREKLMAFVQNQEASDSDDEEPGAPAAAAYQSKSDGITEVLEDMKEKAEGQLSALRKAENESRHNYKMLKQSLEDQIAADSKDMIGNKQRLASAKEQRAAAERDLNITTKDLENAKTELATAQSSCMQVASEHEATVAARTDELKTLGAAKQQLQAAGAGEAAAAAALLQLATAAHGASPIVAMMRKLARKHHSAALAQLASRIASVVRLRGDDPFEKVRGMIEDMVSKLQGEATSATNEKAYCDEQMSRTAAKQDELNDDVAGMTAKVDKSASKSAMLKREVQRLQSDLGELAKNQAEADKIRQASHQDFVQTKSDLEQGLTAVRTALSTLRDYYASGDSKAAFIQDDDSQFEAFMQQPAQPSSHKKASGAGQSIIGLLEVVESDMATNLAKEETEESEALADHEKMSQENKVVVASKEQDVKYKTQESKSLDSTISEVSADRSTSAQEVGAVDEYATKLQARCVAKPETYEERSKRRTAEITGLKEALSALDSEALLQRHSHSRRGRRHMRGAAAALAA